MRKLLLGSTLAAALCLALAATPPQLPVLGQPLPASAGEALTGTHQMAQLAQAGAVVRQYVTSRGVTLRAYASANGTVFGLAWQGVSSPDLATLLGAHYAAYQAAAKAQRHRGPFTVVTDGLVVQLGGHMRDLRGRAYLSHAIPAQLSAAVVR